MVISHVSYFHIRTNHTFCFITGNLQTHLRKTEQKWPQKESHILYKLKVLKDATENRKNLAGGVVQKRHRG